MPTPGAWTPSDPGHTDEHNRLYNEGLFYDNGATPSISTGNLLKISSLEPAMVEGVNDVVSADPIMEMMDSNGYYVFEWTPEYSGQLVLDGPVFDWDFDWFEAILFESQAVADDYMNSVFGSYGQRLARGWWHYSGNSENFDEEDMSAYENRNVESYYVIAGTTYYLVLEGDSDTALDVSPVYASMQHLGGLSTKIDGPIAPSAFPKMYPSLGSIQNKYNPTSRSYGSGSKAEGSLTRAIGNWSRAGGLETVSLGRASVAEGVNSTSRYPGSHALKTYRFNFMSDPVGADQYEYLIMGGSGSGPLRWDANGTIGIQPLPAGFVVAVKAWIVSVSANAENAKSWRLSAFVDVTDSTEETPAVVSFIGTPDVEVLSEAGSVASWDVEIRVGGTSNEPVMASFWTLNLDSTTKTIAKIELIEFYRP